MLTRRQIRFGLSMRCLGYHDAAWRHPEVPSGDHISGGRAGWNVVTSWSQQETWNFGRDTHLDYGTRHERAREQ